MIHAQNTKFVSVTPPAAAVDTGSFTTATIDTAGFEYATIICYMGALEDAFTALKVQEGDASNMSDAADVTGLVLGTSTDIAGAASALTSASDNNVFEVFEVDLRGRKRYLDVVGTVADASGDVGNFMTVLCILTRGTDSPVSASDRGAHTILRA